MTRDATKHEAENIYILKTSQVSVRRLSSENACFNRLCASTHKYYSVVIAHSKEVLQHVPRKMPEAKTLLPFPDKSEI